MTDESPTKPTKKQKELLSFIDSFITGAGYAPSYREIMRALDYRSVSTVATHIDGLIARGWLVKRDNSARSLEVVRAEQSPAEQQILVKIRELESKDGDHIADIAALRKALEILAG